MLTNQFVYSSSSVSSPGTVTGTTHLDKGEQLPEFPTSEPEKRPPLALLRSQ